MDSDMLTAQPSPDLEDIPSVQQPFTWAAARFVVHRKSLRWYVTFVLVVASAVALTYLLTKDIITAIIFLVTAIIFVVAAARKPKHLRYMLDAYGLHIGKKVYAYEAFRSFSVIEEGQVSCILFRPLQLFVPQIAVYCDQKDEETVINILFSRLPLEDQSTDWINWLLDRVRF